MNLNTVRARGCVNLSQTDKAVSGRFVDSSCGEKEATKILLAYATEYGTTREVAEAIGMALCQSGAAVEIKWIKNIRNLKSYDAVIIGSPIQYDKWMPEAIRFVATHENRLSKLPVAFFFTCLTLSKKTAKAESQAITYSDKLYNLHPRIKPLSVGRFAGVLDYSRFSIGFRFIARVIYAIFKVQESDYRDWKAIRAWSQDVNLKISSKVAEAKFHLNINQ